MVTLYEGSIAIGKVRYTDNLDRWNGHDYFSGSFGHHLGVGKLKDGRYFLCHGSQYEGEHDYAEVVSKDLAMEEALEAEMGADDFKKLFGQDIPVLDS